MTSDLSTIIDQLETSVDSLSPECRSFRIHLADAENCVRDLESSPVSTAPFVNNPIPTPPVALAPYLILIPALSNAHTSQIGAASETLTNPRILTRIPPPSVCAQLFTPRLFHPRPFRPPLYRTYQLRAFSPLRAANTDVATASATSTIVASHASTADRVIRYHPCPWTRNQAYLASAIRHRRLI